MIWVSPTNEYFNKRPDRVRLPDGSTRTSEEVTDELLFSLGWQVVEEMPIEEPPIDSNTTAGYSNTTVNLNIQE